MMNSATILVFPLGVLCFRVDFIVAGSLGDVSLSSVEFSPNRFMKLGVPVGAE